MEAAYRTIVESLPAQVGKRSITSHDYAALCKSMRSLGVFFHRASAECRELIAPEATECEDPCFMKEAVSAMPANAFANAEYVEALRAFHDDEIPETYHVLEEDQLPIVMDHSSFILLQEAFASPSAGMEMHDLLDVLLAFCEACEEIVDVARLVDALADRVSRDMALRVVQHLDARMTEDLLLHFADRESRRSFERFSMHLTWAGMFEQHMHKDDVQRKTYANRAARFCGKSGLQRLYLSYPLVARAFATLPSHVNFLRILTEVPTVVEHVYAMASSSTDLTTEASAIVSSWFVTDSSSQGDPAHMLAHLVNLPEGVHVFKAGVSMCVTAEPVVPEEGETPMEAALDFMRGCDIVPGSPEGDALLTLLGCLSVDTVSLYQAVPRTDRVFCEDGVVVIFA